MKQLLFTKGLLPNLLPSTGAHWGHLGTAMNNFYSSPNKVSTLTHYITWLFSFWIWRRCLKFAWFWPFGDLPLGPHGGHTYYLNNFESPTPKDDSCQVWLKSNHAFSRRRWKCKKFTDDGRKRTAIAHLSLWLRWTKNRSSKTRTVFIFEDAIVSVYEEQEKIVWTKKYFERTDRNSYWCMERGHMNLHRYHCRLMQFWFFFL